MASKGLREKRYNGASGRDGERGGQHNCVKSTLVFEGSLLRLKRFSRGRRETKKLSHELQKWV